MNYKHTYKLDKILSLNKLYNFVISMRNGGKTFSALHLALKTYTRYKKSCCFIMRTESQINDSYIHELVNEIEKVIKITFSPYVIKHFGLENITVRGCGIDAKILVNGEILLQFKALNTALAKKRIPVHNVRYLIFDEFILNKSAGETYLKEEFFKLKQLLNTIMRSEDYSTRVIFLGNAESFVNPYFYELGIHKQDLKYNSIIKGETYAVEVFDSEARKQELTSDKLYSALLGHNSYKDYALNSVFQEFKVNKILDIEIKNYTHICYFDMKKVKCELCFSNSKYFLKEVKQFERNWVVLCDSIENKDRNYIHYSVSVSKRLLKECLGTNTIYAYNEFMLNFSEDLYYLL